MAICGWRGWLLLHGVGIVRVYNSFDTHSEVLLMGCLLAIVELAIPYLVNGPPAMRRTSGTI